MSEDALRTLPWLFLVGFVALWLLIFRVAAWWGGWNLLAQSYPAGLPLTGERLRMRSAQLRAGCNYNNCITFVSSAAGLQLSMPLPFRFAHPPVFLPWSELSARREQRWLVELVVLRARRVPDVPIKLRARLAERLLAHAGAELRIEPEPASRAAEGAG